MNSGVYEFKEWIEDIIGNEQMKENLRSFARMWEHEIQQHEVGDVNVDVHAFQDAHANTEFSCENIDCQWTGDGNETIIDENIQIDESDENNLICPKCRDTVCETVVVE